MLKLIVKDSRCTHYKNFTKYVDKFASTFIEIFHAGSLLGYLKHQYLSQKLFEPIFPQPCRNIFRKITRKVA